MLLMTNPNGPSSLICPCMLCSKRKICKEKKSKKNQNAFKYGCKCVSRRCGNYRMYIEGDSLWLCVSVFDFLISQIVIIWDTYVILLCFHTQQANSLLLLIHMQVQCDLAITRNTCVNVYSLNYLKLFLKYKIG